MKWNGMIDRPHYMTIKKIKEDSSSQASSFRVRKIVILFSGHEKERLRRPANIGAMRWDQEDACNGSKKWLICFFDGHFRWTTLNEWVMTWSRSAPTHKSKEAQCGTKYAPWRENCVEASSARTHQTFRPWMATDDPQAAKLQHIHPMAIIAKNFNMVAILVILAVVIYQNCVLKVCERIGQKKDSENYSIKSRWHSGLTDSCYSIDFPTA